MRSGRKIKARAARYTSILLSLMLTFGMVAVSAGAIVAFADEEVLQAEEGAAAESPAEETPAAETPEEGISTEETGEEPAESETSPSAVALSATAAGVELMASPAGIAPLAVPVTDETSLMAAIGAVPTGGSEVIEIQNSFTINSPIRYWDKDITIKSAAGGPYTITRGTFGTASDAVQGTYAPPMIEANATSGTGSITLEDIIIDDANTVGTPAGIGQRAVIAAYDGR
ncbi:MAG: hypothetical protein LBR14_00480, partial [Clostridiales Family XIII bacterium]|nr:hypothetical protein [Clostridiales Family XIII bacterium]